MEYSLNRDQARQIDADAISQLGISGLVLMENAARGVCDFLLAMPAVVRPAIICGHGNNGGDGLALARQLDALNRVCDVYLLNTGKSLSADAVTNLQILQRAGISVIEIRDHAGLERAMAARPEVDLIVDCLLGTGVRGTVRDPFRAVIQFINQCPQPVLSVDVPSGLDCDTGEPCGECVRAWATITFVGLKQGFLSPAAKHWTGDVTTAHIGLPATWVRNWCESQGIDAVG